MPTVNFEFSPNDEVYVLEELDCEKPNKTGLTIQEGIVIRIHTEGLINSEAQDNIAYDVRIQGRTGTTEFKEADVFPRTSDGLDDAMAEFKDRL